MKITINELPSEKRIPAPVSGTMFRFYRDTYLIVDVYGSEARRLEASVGDVFAYRVNTGEFVHFTRDWDSIAVRQAFQYLGQCEEITFDVRAAE